VNILHVSPTYFHGDSVVGGGERYAYELARAMAQREEVALVTFAGRAEARREGPLQVVHLRRFPSDSRRSPLLLSPALLKWLGWADVIHCHQVFSMTTDLPLIIGKVLGKEVFVTDLGGGRRFALSYHLPIARWAKAFLLLSRFSRSLWEETTNGSPPRVHVVYGGVDPEKFCPGGRKGGRVLFVGRLLPHKGVDYLIQALDGGMALDVVGRVYDEEYYQHLRALGAGKAVEFHTEVSDGELVARYQEALVTVAPSVYRDCRGNHTPAPELLGLAALESMACGTPVIATDVASLPEVVEDGVTGFLVPPNDPGALREKIQLLQGDPDLARRMGEAASRRVQELFTWEAVAERCLQAYRQGP
jgi:glycosyltransferase involved in cell wall biosynthesis